MNRPLETRSSSQGDALAFVTANEGASDLVSPKPRIAIITVNYFSAAEVVKMVSSLTNQTMQCALDVCVVDNSCDDDEWHQLQSLLSPLRSKLPSLITHRSKTNSGFSAGNNSGYECLAELDPDVVIIINPDVIVQNADFDSVAEEILLSPHTIFGARTLSDGLVISGLASISKVTGKSRELLPDERVGDANIAYPSGHFIAMHNEVWKSAMGLSEDYFLFAEEVDLVLRLGLLTPDIQVRGLDSVLVSHAGGLTSGASKSMARKSLITFEHATRSSVILFRKHSRLRPWLPCIISARILYAIGVAVVAGPAASRAVFAGLRGGLSWRVTDFG